MTADEDPARAAAALVPLLTERAGEAVRLGRLTDDVVAALDEAGLIRMMAPRRRGGQQASLDAFVHVLAELALGCGSTSWVCGVYAAALYMISSFSDEAQDEVYATAVPKSVAAFQPRGQFLVPRPDWTAADDWQVSGLSGTGSCSLTVADVFVPEHRVLPFSDPTRVLSRSQTLSGEPYFAMPFIPFFVTGAIGTPLGLAKAAVSLFADRVGRRGITYTAYAKQAEAPVTHLQMADASMKVDPRGRQSCAARRWPSYGRRRAPARSASRTRRPSVRSRWLP